MYYRSNLAMGASAFYFAIAVTVGQANFQVALNNQ